MMLFTKMSYIERLRIKIFYVTMLWCDCCWFCEVFVKAKRNQCSLHIDPQSKFVIDMKFMKYSYCGVV